MDARESTDQSSEYNSEEDADQVHPYSDLAKYDITPYEKRRQRHFKKSFHARLMYVLSDDLVYMPSLDRKFNQWMLTKQATSGRVAKIDSQIAALAAR